MTNNQLRALKPGDVVRVVDNYPVSELRKLTMKVAAQYRSIREHVPYIETVDGYWLFADEIDNI